MYGWKGCKGAHDSGVGCDCSAGGDDGLPVVGCCGGWKWFGGGGDGHVTCFGKLTEYDLGEERNGEKVFHYV